MKNPHPIRQALHTAIALSSITLASLAALRATEIHRAGAGFTPDNIRTALSSLAPVAAAWLTLTLAGVVWQIAASIKPSSPKLTPELRAEMLLYHREIPPEAVIIRKKRLTARIACGVICMLSTICCVLLVGNVENLGSWDVESVLKNVSRTAGPWLAVMLTAACAAAAYDRARAKELTELLTQQPVRKIRPSRRSKGSLLIPRLLVGAAAVVLIALGIANGGMRDVLVKAINICTECIGLG